jgi:hypothetical protein
MLHAAQLFLIALTLNAVGSAEKDKGWGMLVPRRS